MTTTYTATYMCGHQASTTNTALRGCSADRVVGWRKGIEGSRCPACDKAAVDARLKEAKERDAVDALPELTGTAKQIAWASDIRRDVLLEAEKLLALRVARSGSKPEHAELAEKIIAQIRSWTDARIWIDRARSAVRAIERAREEVGL